ncbi:uncharacterized protein A4U43_C01F28070 [Asparagus officinalis]|uniref:Uncharacterized protein n=1 Tax=Asparagus officinalis TaxID=4686 RepID=A0A5P1FSP7_ASPOF|nr:uncharacterized protein A4U43_C01F28070 [Asparagus officinalis]
MQGEGFSFHSETFQQACFWHFSPCKSNRFDIIYVKSESFKDVWRKQQPNSKLRRHITSWPCCFIQIRILVILCLLIYFVLVISYAISDLAIWTVLLTSFVSLYAKKLSRNFSCYRR